jgi:hypothetical protein
MYDVKLALAFNCLQVQQEIPSHSTKEWRSRPKTPTTIYIQATVPFNSLALGGTKTVIFPI